MSASSFEKELNKYWPLLTPVQQASILGMIKSFVEPNEGITVEQYNKEIDNAVVRVESGEFYTHEEVEKMSKKW